MPMRQRSGLQLQIYSGVPERTPDCSICAR
nr:MAG TPA: hypothetical protein [Caudoviricetes sp.]